MPRHRKTRAIAFPTVRHSAPPPVMVVASRGRSFRRRAHSGALAVGRRAHGFARRHGRAALPAVGIAIGGLAVGFMDAKGYFNKLPAIGGSRALTLAALGYAATRFVKNPTVRLAGIAAIAAAAFDYGKVHGMGGPSKAHAAGLEEMIGAHDDRSGHFGDGGPY